MRVCMCVCVRACVRARIHNLRVLELLRIDLMKQARWRVPNCHLTEIAPVARKPVIFEPQTISHCPNHKATGDTHDRCPTDSSLT